MSTILWLEDNNFMVEFYSRFLFHSAKVVHAPDGREGLKLFEENPTKYSLIITDQGMPSLDGLGFLKAIQNYERPPRLMISGEEDFRILHRQVRELGGLGLYRKPMSNVGELTKIVQELLKDGKNSPTLEAYFQKEGLEPLIK